jgi:preprotein translocase subunit SecF
LDLKALFDVIILISQLSKNHFKILLDESLAAILAILSISVGWCIQDSIFVLERECSH